MQHSPLKWSRNSWLGSQTEYKRKAELCISISVSLCLSVSISLSLSLCFLTIEAIWPATSHSCLPDFPTMVDRILKSHLGARLKSLLNFPLAVRNTINKDEVVNSLVNKRNQNWPWGLYLSFWYHWGRADLQLCQVTGNSSGRLYQPRIWKWVEDYFKFPLERKKKPTDQIMLWLFLEVGFLVQKTVLYRFLARRGSPLSHWP